MTVCIQIRFENIEAQILILFLFVVWVEGFAGGVIHGHVQDLCCASKKLDVSFFVRKVNKNTGRWTDFSSSKRKLITS